MDHEAPPEDAYGRITDPGRYRILHEAADALVAGLLRDYEVSESPAREIGVDPLGRIDVLRAVRLQPSREDAAPLVVGFTDFPGLLVRFGSWHAQGFPTCGCDACDEAPEDLIHDLHDHVEALVAGGFREELRGWVRPWRDAEFEGPDGTWRRSSSERIDRADLRRLGGRDRRDWRPWPARITSSGER